MDLAQKRLDVLNCCESCRNIAFDRILLLGPTELQQNGRNGCLIANLGRIASRKSLATCVLCQLFFSVRVPSPTLSGEYHLRAYSVFPPGRTRAFKKLPPRLLAQDFPHLAVVPASFVSRPELNSAARFLFLLSQKATEGLIFQPRAHALEIDYASVIADLRFCKARHKSSCGRNSNNLRPSRLIDCSASPPTVVSSPPHTPYLALSYVWGDRSKKLLVSLPNQLPENTHAGNADAMSHCPPRTISDAQIVVRRLGHRYLWVDQCCTDQGNHEDTSTQIMAMDKIYGGADITIVAVCGHHSDHGLPGVSATRRQSTPTVDLGQWQLFSVPSHAHYAIRASKWWTRAWTYQEALLSQRLLFFTEYETYFECQSMQTRECMIWKHDTLHCEQGKLYGVFNSGLVLSATSSAASYVRATATSLMRFYKLVWEYTKRNMRYEVDSLKAFTGIIRHAETCRVPSYQIQGIPFLSHEVETGRTMLMGLLWKHEQDFRPIPPVRRQGFPSWSWTGWEGQARFIMHDLLRFPNFKCQAALTGFGWGIELELKPDVLHSRPAEISRSMPTSVGLRARLLVEDSFSIFYTKTPPHCHIVSHSQSLLKPPHLYRHYVRSGRKPPPDPWLGVKCVFYTHKGPKVLTKLQEYFTRNQLRAALIGSLPKLTSLKGSGRVFFLILEPCELYFYRVGILEVKENFASFGEDWRFEEKSIIIR